MKAENDFSGFDGKVVVALNCLVEKERKRIREDAMYDTETIGW